MEDDEKEEKSSRNFCNKMFLRLPTITNNTISSTMSSKSGNSDDGVPTPSSDSPNRQITEREFRSSNMTSDDNVNDVVDQCAMELFSKSRQQQEEILLIRKQIADAGLKELHMLNEKYTSVKKISDLRMALDEKQNDAITSTSKELAHRKGDLDENIKLIHELKAVEDDRYIFTSAMLRLLDDFDIHPHVINASSISSSIKHLYDQLQWKIRTSHDSIIEINSMLEGQTGDRSFNKEKQPPGVSKGQFFDTSAIPNVSSPYNQYVQEQQLDHTSIPLRSRSVYLQGDIDLSPRANRMQYHPFIGANLMDFPSKIDKGFEGQREWTPFERSTDSYYYPPNTVEEHSSYISEGEGILPGIEGFQILGDAKPGNTLQACGFPVRGTALCMFQWVRHLHNGTGQYIEGATNPDYVVTADDVDKLIAVDCIPMDDKGCQGELVRLLANNQKKIMCDPDMQMEIETHLSEGQATFDVLLWVGLKDTSGVWEPRILILKRYSYQVKNVDDVVFEENYSADLSIQIPCGLTTQFVLTCSDRSSHPFSTHNDVRMRDHLVLTVRTFQSKAIDDKRKGKA